MHFFRCTQRCRLPFRSGRIFTSPEVYAVPEIGAGKFARVIINADKLQIPRTPAEFIEPGLCLFQTVLPKAGTHSAPQPGQIQNTAVPEGLFVHGNQIMAVKIGGHSPFFQNGKHLGNPACPRLTVACGKLPADLLYINKSPTFPAFKFSRSFPEAFIVKILGLGGMNAVPVRVIADFVPGKFSENIGASPFLQHPDLFPDDFERSADSQ